MRCWDQEGREEVTLWEHREGCLGEVVWDSSPQGDQGRAAWGRIL